MHLRVTLLLFFIHSFIPSLTSAKVSYTMAGVSETQTLCYNSIDDGGKCIYVQRSVRNNPDFDLERSAQSDNFVIFWGANIEGDPRDSILNPELWFDPDYILEVSEAFFDYVTDTIGFLDPEGENTSRYKFEIVMNGTWTEQFTGWAFGGPVDNTTGGLWIHPRSSRGPGVIVHEIGHACQGMVTIDNPGRGFHAPYSGFFWEGHTEFLRGVYVGDNWQRLLQRYIMTSMMHFSTIRRYYQNFAFLEYLADEYGFETINAMWHESDMTVDHPLTSLRDKVMQYTQDDLNDDIARSAMRNVTWDGYSREGIREAFSGLDNQYLSRMYTILDTVAGEPGWYIVPEYLAPADYGYNIIPLFPDDGTEKIRVKFTGLENLNAGGAGSRYGFVAVDRDNNVRYSEVFSDTDREAGFYLAPGDEYIYMVVSGAPSEHHNYGYDPEGDFIWEPGYPKYYRYPYKVSFEGALPAGHKRGYNSKRDLYPGSTHINGGGWVAQTARVDGSAFVGPDAQVLGKAKVSGNARIEGYAIVSDNAAISGHAIVRDHASVTGNSVIEDYSLVEKTSFVHDSKISDKAVVSGSAVIMGNSQLSGRAVAKDLAFLRGRIISGTAVVGGDSENYNNISYGTYLSNRRSGQPDGAVIHELNADVNPMWAEYHYPEGRRPSRPIGLKVYNNEEGIAELNWEPSESLFCDPQYYVLKKTGEDWTVIGTSWLNNFSVEGLQNGKEYIFKIQATDRSGNLSEKSNAALVKTEYENQR